LPDEGSETLGGLIYEAAGNVPEIGDQIEVADFSVKVEDVVDQRILRVTISAEEPFPGHAKRDQ
jgi:CBS domain containing-hemolysin-like protein